MLCIAPWQSSNCALAMSVETEEEAKVVVRPKTRRGVAMMKAAGGELSSVPDLDVSCCWSLAQDDADHGQFWSISKTCWD